MKVKTSLLKLVMVLLVSVSFFSCSDGEDGAPGPSGADGTDGVNGIDGVDGEQGDPGTANVIYSDWLEQGFGGVPIESSAEGFDIEAPEITNDILSNGVMLIYGLRANTVAENVEVTYYQLPYTFYGSLQVEYRYRIDPPTSEKAITTIRIQARKLDDTDLNLNAATLISAYRYVIIPGGIEATGKSSNVVDYSKMSYEEIIAQFNIPE